jgi:hypothetical protein
MLEFAQDVIDFIHRRRGMANYLSNFVSRRRIDRLRVALARGAELHRSATKLSRCNDQMKH